MASSAGGNQNQPGGGGPFDVQMLFKQSNSPTPNPINLPPSSYPPYPYPPQTAPFHQPYLAYQQQEQQQQQQQHQHQHQQQLSNMHPQRPISYPTPQQPPARVPSPSPNPGARLMALLGSTTNTTPSSSPPPLQATVSSLPATSDYSVPINPRTLVETPSAPNPNFALSQPTPSRLPSSKLPRGRKLSGDHAVYDIDVRMQGEVQPQLEVTPITKYVSDPGLVVGRQIAVNRSYICYGLKLGAIRILNINTAIRSLLRGHTQSVTDMAFFNEEVHLLASASTDGRVFVWKISEGPDAEDKPQITGHINVAIHIVGEGDSVHPRVCWHCHKQEFLVVGIGKRVLKIDITKVGKNGAFSAEEPLKCSVDKLIDGVHYVGKHDGDVTDLSMCQWMTTRLASASVDGTVKIWDDRKAVPLAILRPHDGQPVYSATFLTAHQPQHINLITAGPLNREVKIWASTSEEGWLLPSDAESWQCTQTLYLKSSVEPNMEDAFFNQVMALPSAGLIVLANAKKNAIYAVHIDYGQNPASTRMDYIAEFTVTMPILSLTGTSDCSPDGQHVVQVYCVQTQAIQQYALDLSQCLPPMLDSMGSGKVDSSVFRDVDMPSSDGFASKEPPKRSTSTEMPIGSDAQELPVQLSSSEGPHMSRFTTNVGVPEAPSVPGLATSVESKQTASTPRTADSNNIRAASPPLPLSPRISRQMSGFQSPSNSFELCLPRGDRGVSQPVHDYKVDRRVEIVQSLDESSKKDEKEVGQDEMVPNPPIVFKHPTHLITPSEILSMAAASSENSQVSQVSKGGEAKVQDVIRNDGEGVVVEVKVVGENEMVENAEVETEREPHIHVSEKKEKAFCSQASDLNFDMAKECCALSTEMLSSEKRHVNDAKASEALDQPPGASEEEMQDARKNVLGKVSELDTATTVQQPTTSAPKVDKQKGLISQVSGPSSPSPSIFSPPGSSDELGSTPIVSSLELASSQILSIQETLNQLISMQKDLQKQMAMVSTPVTKEGKRVEAALGRSMEKAIKASTDALWARFQEENAKHEKLERERTQQITSLITNCMNKDLPAMLEKTLKKELAVFGQAVARLVTPAVEKTVSSSITEAFQRGIGDKAVTQLEKSVSSKLEATVARQIHAQFQTSGKQVLQDSLRSSMEASVLPAFEVSCKAMFEQVDAVFQKGMVEHTNAAKQQYESTHSPLALALRDAINSASSIAQTLTGEMVDGQRKLLALAAAGTNSKAANPLVTQLSNGPVGGIHEIAMPVQQVETPLDPTKELSRLISERKFEEAFTGALQRSDVSIVSWLCSQVDLQKILSMTPLPLNQGVLLALLQQLACDISKETSKKLAWMRDVAVAINPADPMIAAHVRPIFEQVYQILGHQLSLPTTTAAEASSIRLVMHVINSILMSCK